MYERMYGRAPKKDSEVLKLRYWRTGKCMPGNREHCLLFGKALELSETEMEFVSGENIRKELARLFLLDSPSLLVFAGLSVIFCVLAPVLGFFSSGFLIMTGAAFYLGNRELKWVVLFPIVFMVLLWFVFVILLSVRFPAGILI